MRTERTSATAGSTCAGTRRACSRCPCRPSGSRPRHRPPPPHARRARRPRPCRPSRWCSTLRRPRRRRPARVRRQLQLAVATPGTAPGRRAQPDRPRGLLRAAHRRAPAGLGRDLAAVGRPAPVRQLRRRATSRTSTSTITPPRAPSARAGRHRRSASKPSRAPPARSWPRRPGAIEILPYHELELEAMPGDPQRAAAACASRPRAGHDRQRAARGRARRARPRGEASTLSFSPPQLHLEPTTPTDAQLTAQPAPAALVGRPREQTLAVSGEARPAPRRPPPQIVAVRQRAWIPFWLPPADLALVAALAAAFVLTRPETATMPALDRRDVQRRPARDRPRRLHADARAADAPGPPPRRDRHGHAARSRRPATDARRDAKILLVVGVGREQTARVPNLKGLDLDQAQTALRKADSSSAPRRRRASRARRTPGPRSRASGRRSATGRARSGSRRPRARRSPPRPPDQRPSSTETPLSLDGLRTLAIADTQRASTSTRPATATPFRLNADRR